MCGILGVVFRDPHATADEAAVVAARQTMQHRGPDEAGLWVRPGVALAHRRLKVLDLTHGQQPMVCQDDRHALVYNGEIYNYRSLRDEYRLRGIEFTTDCDTEVVLKAIAGDGADAIGRFNGMFAIAQWDDADRQLLLVRDRLGQKPLYWYADDDLIAFASELKALLEYLDRRFDVDPVALDQYFTRGYVLSPRTIFKGISKLPAGHLLKLDARADRWRWKVEAYWDYQPCEAPGGDEAALDQLDELLTDAVRLRMVSDVPLGCLLSGGIDSSLITAVASRVTDEPLNAFSIGFDESQALNELPYAQMVAEQFNCNWRVEHARADDFRFQLDDMAHYFDEPFCNFAMFPMRQLTQMARRELVVVLSGQGGDELSAGYPGRYGWAVTAQDNCEPGIGRFFVDDVVQHLAHANILGWSTARRKMYSPVMTDAVRSAGTPVSDMQQFWQRHRQLDRLNSALYVDVKTNLPDYLVCVEERMGMAASLEARNPMLDFRLVNFMLSLPADMKVRNGQHKWILLELARRYGLARAVDRPKRGFTPPINLWMQQNAGHVAETLEATDTQTRSLYSSDWRQYQHGGDYDHTGTMPLLYCLMLAKWTQRYERFIGDWPGQSEARPSASTGRRWHDALDEHEPVALAEARFFEQAMKNFKPGDRIHLVGKDDDWFAFLAENGGGLQVLDRDSKGKQSIQGIVLVGFDAMTKLTEQYDPALAEDLGDGKLLIVAPFPAAKQSSIEPLLQKLAESWLLKGCQVVQLGKDQLGIAICANAGGNQNG